MKRRDFFKKSSLAVSALTISGISGSNFKDLFAKNKPGTESFSFELITDQPEEALKLTQEFFIKNEFNNEIIKFSEYPVEGEVYGDIVFVKNGKLINYKNGSDELNSDVRFIADSLSLPKKISNPTRLRFYLSENNSPSEKFLIFHKNILIKTILSNDNNLNLKLNGSKGNVILNIENKKARVISSSCTHKTCVNSGSIAFSGESIVCIPNELLIICE